MSSFTSLKPWTAAAIVGLLAAAPSQGQVLSGPSDGLSAIQIGQWQPGSTPSEGVSLPPTSEAVDQALDSALSASPQANVTQPVITKVYSHQVDDQDAVTLYVRDIPVLTFLADDAEEAASSPQSQNTTPADSAVAAPDAISPATAAASTTASKTAAPMERAQSVAQKLEAVYGQLEATPDLGIQMTWNDQDEQYWITAGDRPLVALDELTVAVQPSANLTSDLIQTTNRLRRLVHNGEPLQYSGERQLRNPAVQVASATTPAPAAISSATVRSTQLGIASWYGGYFHGRRTANGERYNQNAMTAAHRHLPFGTRVRVVNLNNGRSTIVRINDRGPFIRGRIIDLSAAAAGEIGMRGAGIAQVRVEVLR